MSKQLQIESVGIEINRYDSSASPTFLEFKPVYKAHLSGISGQVLMKISRIPPKRTFASLIYTLLLDVAAIELLDAMFTEQAIVEKTGFVTHKDLRGFYEDRGTDESGRKKKSTGKSLFEVKIKWDGPSRWIGIAPYGSPDEDLPSVIGMRLSALETVRIVKLLRRVSFSSELLSIGIKYFKSDFSGNLQEAESENLFGQGM